MARSGGKDRGLFERPEGSGVWWILYYDSEGGRHREKIGPKALARKRYMQRKTEIAEDRYFPRTHRRVALFSDLLKDYREAKERQGKAIMRGSIGYRRLLERFGGRRPESITAAEVEAWQSDLMQGMSIESANHHLKLLRAILLRAVASRGLRHEDVPPMKLENPNNRRLRYLMPEEEPALLENLPERFRPLIVVALHTGMRKGELLNLKWTDVDFLTGTIHVREAKSGEGRRLPMNSVARSALLGLSEQHRERLRAKVVRRDEADAYIFTAPEGGFIHDLNRYWYPALMRAGVGDFHFHDLRHTFATRYMMAGGNLYSLQILLGHKTTAMTQRYAHLSRDHLQAEVERLAAAPTASELVPTNLGAHHA